jgi:DNA-binding HxlR family transcriptional regulator
MVEGKVDFERLAEKIGVKSEKIKELFDVENNSLTLLKVIGEDERDKTKKISLAVLLGYKYTVGNEQVFSKEIRRNVAENRISVNNFATYLNEMIPSLIRRTGKPKSPKTTYRLTPLGEAEAKEILKKLCK